MKITVKAKLSNLFAMRSQIYLLFTLAYSICGCQLLTSNDDGTQLIPVPVEDSLDYGQRPPTPVLEDVEEFGAFDSQG